VASCGSCPPASSSTRAYGFDPTPTTCTTRPRPRSCRCAQSLPGPALSTTKPAP
jgi:hypothetical protein